MAWLTEHLRALNEWMLRNVLSAFRWLGDRVLGAIKGAMNAAQFVAVGLLATVAGVAPGESLAATWRTVLGTFTWLSGWPLYVLVQCFAFDVALARMTYFVGLLLAAYALRLAFSAARAALDLF